MGILAELAAKYGVKALVTLTLILSLVAGYYIWKHGIERDARAEERAQCTAERNKFHDDAEEFKRERSDEIAKLNASHKKDLEDAQNNANDRIRAAASVPIPARVLIRTNPRNSCVNGMPTREGDRTEAKKGNESVDTAELPRGNIEKLDRVMRDIETLQINCEQIVDGF